MLKNIKTVIRHPHIARLFAGWYVKKNLLGQEPTKIIRDSISIGDLSGFSEYLAVDNFLTDEEFAFFSNLELGGGDIIDIGANIGVLSIMFAQTHPDNTVYAIEPNPSTYKSLCLNVKRNSIPNIKCREFALAKKEGFTPFNTDPVSRGTASIAKSNSEGVNLVRCTTLDQFVAQEKIEKISLMKIDVEGYETLVFQGGEHLFKKMKPSVVYFEVYPSITKRAGFEPNLPAKMLLEAGYKLYQLRADGSLNSADIADIADINYENWVALWG